MKKLFAIWRILWADKFALFTFEDAPDDPEWQTAPYFRWRLSHDDEYFIQLIKNVLLNIEKNNNENKTM
jgi:hypothetical protein